MLSANVNAYRVPQPDIVIESNVPQVVDPETAYMQVHLIFLFLLLEYFYLYIISLQ